MSLILIWGIVCHSLCNFDEIFILNRFKFGLLIANDFIFLVIIGFDGKAVESAAFWAKYSLQREGSNLSSWLRRLTRNQFPSGSVGSKPSMCEAFCFYFNRTSFLHYIARNQSSSKGCLSLRLQWNLVDCREKERKWERATDDVFQLYYSFNVYFFCVIF